MKVLHTQNFSHWMKVLHVLKVIRTDESFTHAKQNVLDENFTPGKLFTLEIFAL